MVLIIQLKFLINHLLIKLEFIDFKRMKIFAEELQGNLIGSSFRKYIR